MLDHTVGDDDLLGIQGHRGVFVIQGVGIQEDGVVRHPHGAGKLIHDAALHADVLIFRLLADEGQLDHGQLGEAEEFPGGQGGHHLQGSRGGQPRSGGNIAIDQEISPRGDGIALFPEGPQDALGVIGPARPVAGRQIVQAGADHAGFLKIEGMKIQLPVLPPPRHAVGADAQGAGEDVAAVVIRVLPDQVHPPRGEEDADVPAFPVNFFKAFL